LSATQDAQSSIVTLSASDANFDGAARIVNAALKVYDGHARQLISERGKAAIDGINAILVREKTSPTDPAPPPGDTRTDRQTPTDQLQAQLYWIEVQTQRLTPFQVVSPPSETNTGGVPKWQLGVVGGALLGGLALLGGALVWRRRVGVVTSPSALDPVVQRVLVPTVALGRLAPGSAAHTALARTLNNQLSAARAGTILVVGASAESGTSDIARLIAAAGKEHSEVRLVDLSGSPDSVEAFRAGLASGTASVIDGGSIDTSPLLPQAADVAGQVVVVARIGSDVIDEVRTTALLATDRDLPVCAVCTRGSSRRDSNTKHRTPLQAKRTRRSSVVPTGDDQTDKTERLSIPSK
jgi:hypothetical protein